MGVTNTMTAPTGITGTLAGRLGALAGIGFALSLFVGVAMLSTRWPAWVGGAATAVVVASALLSAVFAISAFLVWAIAASVALWRRPSR